MGVLDIDLGADRRLWGILGDHFSGGDLLYTGLFSGSAIWSDDERFPGDALRFVFAEAAKGTNEIGFIPRPRVERDASAGRVVVVVENGDLVAWALVGVGSPGKLLPLQQLWTRSDARRHLFASAAVAAVCRHAQQKGRSEVQARCAIELRPANLLWDSLGFTPVALRRGGKSRSRRLLLWRRDVAVRPNAGLVDPLAFGQTGRLLKLAAGAGETV